MRSEKPPTWLRLIKSPDKPRRKRKAVHPSSEFPRAVAAAIQILDRVNLSGHPALVEMLAVSILGEWEADRRLTAAKLDEVAGMRSVITASELEWIAMAVREGERTVDGDFLSVAGDE